MDKIPFWLKLMNNEDINFIKRFILSSGSLKKLAEEYDVTYPTLRIRLDRLIEKIKVRDESQQDDDSYTLIIKEMAINGEIEKQTAKKLIEEYKKKGNSQNGNMV